MKSARARVVTAVTGMMVVAASAFAQSWQNFAIISMTNPVTPKQVNGGICFSDISGSLLCDSGSGRMTTSGSVVFTNVSATALTVNGVAITGSGSGQGDRISSSGVVSGSGLGAVVTSYGTVSFTTGGTAGTAYLDTTGRYIGPGVSITSLHGVSSTNGYFSGNVGIGAGSPLTQFQINPGTFSTKRDVLSIGINPNAGGYTALVMGLSSSTFGYSYIDSFSQSGSTFGSLILNPTGNNNVGIGTTSPNAKLDVAGTISGTTALFSSNIGIGTSNPSVTLHIDPATVGEIVAIGPTWNGGNAYNTGNKTLNLTSWNGTPALAIFRNNIAGYYLRVSSTGAFEIQQYGTSYSPALVVQSSTKNLGLGTYTPASSLTIAAGEVQTASSGAACSSTNAGAIRYSGGSLSYCNSSAWTAIAGSSASAVSGTGAVQFSTNGSGAFGADAANLYWDDGNKRLGVGTANPTGKLEVAGQVLISTTDDASGVGVLIARKRTTGAVQQGDRLGYLVVQGASGVSTSLNSIAISGYAQENFSTSAGGAYIQFETVGTGSTTRLERMRIAANGEVGIGTSYPNAKLDVVGLISSTNIYSGAASFTTLATTSNTTVSGTVKLSGTGTEGCTSTVLGTIRIEPTTGRMQMCKMPN